MTKQQIIERLSDALRVLEGINYDAKGTAEDYQQTPAYAAGFARSAIEGALIGIVTLED